MINILITLLVVALIVGVIWYICDSLPVPEPINKIVKLVAICVGVIAIVMAILSLGGYDTGLPLRR